MPELVLLVALPPLIYSASKITDEIRRRIERDLDLEEANFANREYRRTPL